MLMTSAGHINKNLNAATKFMHTNDYMHVHSVIHLATYCLPTHLPEIFICPCGNTPGNFKP